MELISNPLKKKKPNNAEYHEGKNAYSNGLELNNNPYREVDSDLALLWNSGWNDAFEARHEYENKKPSRIISFLMKLKRGWGMIFRFLFIVSIGFIGYYWIDPQSIGDIPFSQLTLNLILKKLFAGLLILGCIVWFFRFPERHEEMKDEDDPYSMWANISCFFIFIGFLIWLWLSK